MLIVDTTAGWSAGCQKWTGTLKHPTDGQYGPQASWTWKISKPGCEQVQSNLSTSRSTVLKQEKNNMTKYLIQRTYNKIKMDSTWSGSHSFLYFPTKLIQHLVWISKQMPDERKRIKVRKDNKDDKHK